MINTELSWRQGILQDLLDLIMKLVNANRTQISRPNEREYYADGIAIKLFLHASSALHLSKKTEVEGFERFYDVASICILSRAALESFLIFYYVFVEPKTLDDQNYRYWAWKLAGLLVIQKIFEADNPKMLLMLDSGVITTLNEGKKRISELRKLLESNSIFLQLKPKQQKTVLSEGKFRLLPGLDKQLSWKQIGRRADLGNLVAWKWYELVCEYAHSGSVGIEETIVAIKQRKEPQIISRAMEVIMISLSNLINDYHHLFNLQHILSSDDKALIDIGIKLGKALHFDQNNNSRKST